MAEQQHADAGAAPQETLYEIRTVEDFRKVPADRLPLCIMSFIQWLHLHASYEARAEEYMEINGIQQKLSDVIVMPGNVFNWIDDGSPAPVINDSAQRGSTFTETAPQDEGLPTGDDLTAIKARAERGVIVPYPIEELEKELTPEAMKHFHNTCDLAERGYAVVTEKDALGLNVIVGYGPFRIHDLCFSEGMVGKSAWTVTGFRDMGLDLPRIMVGEYTFRAAQLTRLTAHSNPGSGPTREQFARARALMAGTDA